MVKISDSELVVMNIIWCNGGMTSREIIKECQKFGTSWNDNTIRTLINRLVEKKALGIVNKIGKSYTFVSVLDEAKYKAKMTRQFINQIYDGSFRDFFTDVLKEYTLTKNEKNELLDIIHKKMESM